MHARQQLLESLRATLKAVSSPPWRGVYVASSFPGKASLPALLIGQPSESVSDAGLYGQRRQDRSLTVTVVGWMSARPDPEDTRADLNAVAEALEVAVALPALPDADDLGLIETTTNDEPDENGLVSVALSWWVRYATLEGRPATFGTD